MISLPYRAEKRLQLFFLYTVQKTKAHTDKHFFYEVPEERMLKKKRTDDNEHNLVNRKYEYKR